MAAASPADKCGWQELTLSFEHEQAAAHRLAGFGDQVRVLSPPAVTERLVAVAQGILDRYRAGAVRSLSAIVVTADQTAVPQAEDRRRARELSRDLDLGELSSALLDIEIAHADAASGAVTGKPSGAARATLEQALRRAAVFATTERLHTALIDLANAVRPVS